ncbi:hypothetical protein [Arthrobacter sp. JSM 101049]|uniref:hypothetical protein n=1 Tax=Arthrobacter sp. JSM 101049 TaxID=929097 RepID=UPI003564920A
MDASALNALVLGLVGLIVFFYLLYTTVRAAVRAGIRDARADPAAGSVQRTADENRTAHDA